MSRTVNSHHQAIEFIIDSCVYVFVIVIRTWQTSPKCMGKVINTSTYPYPDIGSQIIDMHGCHLKRHLGVANHKIHNFSGRITAKHVGSKQPEQNWEMRCINLDIGQEGYHLVTVLANRNTRNEMWICIARMNVPCVSGCRRHRKNTCVLLQGRVITGRKRSKCKDDSICQSVIHAVEP